MNATYLLIILCFLSFGLEIAAISFGVSPDYILDEFGFSGANIFAKPWIFITCIFLHFDMGHLISNMFVLLFFGTSVENELGRLRMLLIFFLGAVVGDVFSLFFYQMDVVSIGASAGIFALVGAGMLIKPFDMSFYPFIVPMPLGLIGILYAVYNTIGLFSGVGNISYVAHFGGLFTGLLFGFAYGGIKHGLKIIIVMLAILLLVPLIMALLISL